MEINEYKPTYISERVEEIKNRLKSYVGIVRTHNDGITWEECARGTSFKGEITCDYGTLVSLFGEPFGGDGYKVDAEWYICFESPARHFGTQKPFASLSFTIYNWKDGLSYNEDGSGKPTHEITNWHIGTKARDSFNVNEILNKILI